MDALRSVVRRRARPLDVALLAAVPVALVGVFALPTATKRAFVLSYTQPTLTAMYLANFVHFTPIHLLTNLLVYLLVAPVGYLCFLAAGKPVRFRVGHVTFLTVLPFALSALNTLAVRPMVGYGFSGVNMAYLGLLPAALVSYYKARFAENLTLDHAMILFFAGAALITVLAVPLRYSALLVLGFALTGIGVYGYELVREVSELSLAGVKRLFTDDPAGYAQLAVNGVLVYYAVPFVAFPPAPVQGSVIINYYIHFLGFSFGFMVPYLTFRGLTASGWKM